MPIIYVHQRSATLFYISAKRRQKGRKVTRSLISIVFVNKNRYQIKSITRIRNQAVDLTAILRYVNPLHFA